MKNLILIILYSFFVIISCAVIEEDDCRDTNCANYRSQVAAQAAFDKSSVKLFLFSTIWRGIHECEGGVYGDHTISFARPNPHDTVNFSAHPQAVHIVVDGVCEDRITVHKVSPVHKIEAHKIT